MRPPLNKCNRIAVKRFFQAEFVEFLRALHAIKVEMIDRRFAGIPMPKRKRGAGCLVFAVARAHCGADERRLARTQLTGERNDVARLQRARELRGEGFEGVLRWESLRC